MMKELFIESIRIFFGVPQLLHYHIQRMNRTGLAKGFIPACLPDLVQIMPKELGQKVVKCRILYREEIEEISFAEYSYRPIRSVVPVRLPAGYTYSYKSADRRVLDELRAQSGADEVLLVNDNGLLTDSSFSNLAFLQDGKWYTPLTPLLEGVRRAYLIDQGFLTPRDIPLSELKQYSLIRFINAMRSV